MKRCLLWMVLLASTQAYAVSVALDANKLTVADALVGNGQTITTGNAAISWDTATLSSPQTAYILTFSFDAIPTGDTDSFLRLNSTVGWGLATQSSTTMKLASTQSAVVGDPLTINTTDTFALSFATLQGIGHAIISNLNTGAYVELTSTDYEGVNEANFKIASNAYARIWTNSGTNQLTMGEIADLSGLSLAQVRAVARSGTYATVMYWKGGNGNWSDASWSETADGSGTMLYTNEVPTYFAEDATATIHVDSSDVAASALTISAGAYTFTGNSPTNEASDLNVSGGAATFTMNIEAKSVEISLGGSLTANAITVHQTFTMDSGSLSVATLNGTGNVTITGGHVTLGDISGVQGAVHISESVLNGSTVLNTSRLSVGNSTVSATGNVIISNATLTGAIEVENAASLVFEGEISLGDAFQGVEEVHYSENGVSVDLSADNGYKSITTVYTVVQGDLSQVSSSAVWKDKNGEACQYDAGTVHHVGSIDTATYWLNADASLADLVLLPTAESIMINGAELEIAASYEQSALLQTTDAGGTILLNGSAAHLKSSDIAEGTSGMTLDGNGRYHTEGNASLHRSGRVSLADTWVGTVATGDLTGSVVDVTSLSNASSRLEMGNVSAERILAGPALAASAEMLTLTGGASTLSAAHIQFGDLSLGSTEKAAYLELHGELTMTGNIHLGNAESQLKASSLGSETSALNFQISPQQLFTLNTETAFMILETPATGVPLTINGEKSVAEDKFVYTIGWNSAHHAVLLTPEFITDFYNKAAQSANGSAGAALVTAGMIHLNPQVNKPTGDLAKVMDSLDSMIRRHAAGADSLMAAIAGASSAAMGHAFSADMHRQLRSIRNRTTTMGVTPTVVHEDMPYFNAWLHAEMDHTALSESGTKSGYQLTHGGGTLGFDIDATPQITFGLAFSAIWGDFSAKSAEHADGDLDIYYLTLFGRYISKRWTHTFVTGIGWADSSLERSVTHTMGRYTTRGDSAGMNFGFMYELGYVFALDEDSETCLQPVFNVSYTHGHMDGYTEQGSDAALRIGKMKMNTVVLSAGVRMQTSAASDACNHFSIFEARALLKCYLGDRACKGDVALCAVPTTEACVTSASQGVAGAELGVGLTVPLTLKSSAIFFDAAALFSSGYTHVNATVGYRVNF